MKTRKDKKFKTITLKKKKGKWTIKKQKNSKQRLDAKCTKKSHDSVTDKTTHSCNPWDWGVMLGGTSRNVMNQLPTDRNVSSKLEI